MATLVRPQTRQPRMERELCAALLAGERAYEQLMVSPRPDPRLLVELRNRAHALTEAAAYPSANTPRPRSERIRRRCVAADRGAEWIMSHCHRPGPTVPSGRVRSTVSFVRSRPTGR